MKINSILLITGNSGKADEFEELIDLKELEFVHKSLVLPEIQSMSLEDIGRFKTRTALERHDDVSKYDAVLTDDTALFCEVMNGLPGPLIKWFLDCLGADGIYELVKNKTGETSAECLLSLGITSTREIIQFDGIVQGKLVSPRGSYGFGWDRIFLPRNKRFTYGEMLAKEKNKISHRALAVEKMRNWIIE